VVYPTLVLLGNSSGTSFALPLARMARLLRAARTFLRDDSGQDLAEYGLLASLVAIAVMAAVGDVGSQFGALWTHIIDQLEALL
jgi:Flp pilus assembly pilin Flp